MSKKQIPINRINKFFSGEDFFLEVQFRREFIEGDLNMTVVLFRVDRENTMSDDLYGESEKDGIKYKVPVELKVRALIKEPENKTYNESAGSLRYLQDGQLVFEVYQEQLDELGVEISFGDYVGYSVTETEMVYFSVVNDGSKNYDNKHSIFGYKGASKTITCAPIDDNEFSG